MESEYSAAQDDAHGGLECEVVQAEIDDALRIN